jgi:hypothetical protein
MDGTPLFYEIKLLLMILVAFQPDIPILMVTCGEFPVRYCPKTGVSKGDNQLKMMPLNFHPLPNPELITVNPQSRKFYGLKIGQVRCIIIGQVHLASCLGKSYEPIDGAN